MKFIDRAYNALLFKYYKVSVGKGFSCVGRLIIQGHGKYVLGSNVRIHSKESSNPVGGNRTVFQTINSGSILIGNNVGISHAVMCAREKIEIEDNVMIGGGVAIYDNDFHPIDYQKRISSPNENVQTGKVRIMEGAFIGARSIILKGVTIGRHSVVGAGSVVSKDIPDNEVWAGNPARRIR